MVKSARVFLLLLAGIVLSALVEPWAIKGLTAVGYYDAPGAALNWLARLVGEAAFPWLAGGVLGLTIGVWLDALLRRTEKSKPSYKSLTRALYNDMERIRKDVNDAMRNIGHAPATLAADIKALHTTLRKWKFVVPQNTDHDLRYLVINYIYLTRVNPLVRECHIKEAKREARSVIVLEKEKALPSQMDTAAEMQP